MNPGMPEPPYYEIVYQSTTDLYRVRLSISLQQYLGVYEEFDEDENRWYVWTRKQLHGSIARAQEQAESYRGDVLNAQSLERMGATYQDTLRLWCKGANPVPDDLYDAYERYDANEDLAFLYGELSLLHAYLNDALSHAKIDRT
jgi:hypothetical protein